MEAITDSIGTEFTSASIDEVALEAVIADALITDLMTCLALRDNLSTGNTAASIGFQISNPTVH